MDMDEAVMSDMLESVCFVWYCCAKYIILCVKNAKHTLTQKIGLIGRSDQLEFHL